MIHTFEADGIMLRYGLRTILSGIYIKSQTGFVTGLAGNNGSGKSSLLKIMFGTLEPESKSLRINGRHTPCPYKQHNAVNYLPQKKFLPPGRTAKRIFNDFNLDIAHFVNTFGVEVPPAHKAGSLHNGTARLVEIYILAKTPSLFTMLDEPFAHLSPMLAEKLMGFLQEEKKHKGIIVTDHNFHYLKHIADDLFFLNNGRLKHITDVGALESYMGLFEI